VWGDRYIRDCTTLARNRKAAPSSPSAKTSHAAMAMAAMQAPLFAHAIVFPTDPENEDAHYSDVGQ
jgi:hypothetical protein